MALRLPVEILSALPEYYPEDSESSRALLMCALICKDWIGPSRRAYFRNRKILYTPDARRPSSFSARILTLKMIENSHSTIARYIQILYILRPDKVYHTPESDINLFSELKSVLSKLTGLRCLGLAPMSIPPNLSSSALRHLWTDTRLRRLEVWSVNWLNLCQASESFPYLQTLHIHFQVSRSQRDTTPPPLPPSLRSLRIDVTDKDECITTLMTPNSQISHLFLFDIGQNTANAACSAVTTLGVNLRALALDFRGGMAYSGLDWGNLLHQNTELMQLAIGTLSYLPNSESYYALQNLCRTITSISSARLETLNVLLYMPINTDALALVKETNWMILVDAIERCFSISPSCQAHIRIGRLSGDPFDDLEEIRVALEDILRRVDTNGRLVVTRERDVFEVLETMYEDEYVI